MGRREAVSPPQRFHLIASCLKPVVDQHLDGKVPGQRSRAFTSKTEHEQGRTGLAGWSMRAVVVVSAGGEHGVEFARDHALEGPRIQTPLGCNHLRFGAGSLHLLGGHHSHRSAGAGLVDLRGQRLRDHFPVLGDVAPVAGHVGRRRGPLGVGNGLLVQLDVRQSQQVQPDCQRHRITLLIQSVRGQAPAPAEPKDALTVGHRPQAAAALGGPGIGIADQQPFPAHVGS